METEEKLNSADTCGSKKKNTRNMSRLKKLMRMQMEGVRQTVNGQLMKVMDCRSPVADSRPIQPVYFRHYIFYCGLALRLQNNRTKQLSI